MDVKNVTKYVGNQIKQFRESKSITQQELADILGTTQQSIARYESGERKADQNVLFTLAEYFGISINNFFPDFTICNVNNKLDELDLLWAKHKDILTDDDKATMKFIFENRKKQIDEQKKSN